MLNALIAMRLENMNTFTKLVERLTYDPHLRYICGFEPFGTAPSKSCFSRFYAKLAKSDCLEILFSSLVKQAEEKALLDLSSVAIPTLPRWKPMKSPFLARMLSGMVFPPIGALRVIPTATP